MNKYMYYEKKTTKKLEPGDLVTSEDVDVTTGIPLDAMMLIRLVKYHKDNCNNEDCGISTFTMADVYKRLVGRELTTEEFKIFM